MADGEGADGLEGLGEPRRWALASSRDAGARDDQRASVDAVVTPLLLADLRLARSLRTSPVGSRVISRGVLRLANTALAAW